MRETEPGPRLRDADLDLIREAAAEAGQIALGYFGKDPDVWADVREHLPLLAQKKWHSKVKRGYARGWEPVKYVDNIRSYYDILVWATSEQYRARQEQRAAEAAAAADEDVAPPDSQAL